MHRLVTESFIQTKQIEVSDSNSGAANLAQNTNRRVVKVVISGISPSMLVAVVNV